MSLSPKEIYDGTVRHMMQQYNCEKLYIKDMSYETAVITIQNSNCEKIKDFPPQISLDKFKEVLDENRVSYEEFMYHPHMSLDDAADAIAEERNDPCGIKGLDDLYRRCYDIKGFNELYNLYSD